MSAKPPISIIVPNYNGGSTLEATLLSLLEQNYPSLEILVVDGGSSDNSVEVIRKYNRHLTWWTSEGDRGQSHAINKGLAKATGEVLNWLCSDDLLLPHSLQTVGAAFAEDPSADIVVGAGQCTYLHRRGAVVTWRPNAHRISLMPCDCAVPQPSCFFRRRLLGRPEPLDEGLHFALDLELWCYFRSQGARWKLIDEVLSMSVNSGTNKTCAGGERAFAEMVAVYRRYVRERVPLTFWQMLIRRRFQRSRSRSSARNWRILRLFFRPPERALDRLLGCFYGMDRVRTMNWSGYYELADEARGEQTRMLQQADQRRRAMSNPLFSVIIPVFNRAALVRDAVDSVLAQSFASLEVIVVDDGSTDATADALAAYGDRIRVFRQTNRGPGAARNVAIRNARGEYVTFLDSDDLWFPWTLSTFSDIIAKYRPAVILGNCIEFGDDGEISHLQPKGLHARVFPTQLAACHLALRPYPLVIKAAELRDVGGFVESAINCEDHDLLFRLGTKGPFVALDSPVSAAVRRHRESVSWDPSKNYAGICHILSQERNGLYPGEGIMKRHRQRAIAAMVRWISRQCLATGRTRWACDLYAQGLRWNLQFHPGHVVGFPFRMCVAVLSRVWQSMALEASA